MYLSRVRVVTEGLNTRALYDLLQGRAYGNHQLLWRLFPHAAQRPFLFRQELERDAGSLLQPRGMPLFYVLSDWEPEPVAGLLNTESKRFEPRLQTGQRLGFLLRANPTVARREEGRGRSRDHDVLMDVKRHVRQEKGANCAEVQAEMDAAARRWLMDETRSAVAGYRLLSEPEVSGYRQHRYRRRQSEIRFSSVDYRGLLEVTDPERFTSMLARGIGRSRAFGCGLWMIRRVA